MQTSINTNQRVLKEELVYVDAEIFQRSERTFLEVQGAFQSTKKAAMPVAELSEKVFRSRDKKHQVKLFTELLYMAGNGRVEMKQQEATLEPIVVNLA